jgi:hypothetical protein
MSKYGVSWADAYSLPGSRYMAKAASKCDCVCCSFVCSTNFLCAWCELFIWERERRERERQHTYNEWIQVEWIWSIVCRGHFKTMEYMKSHGVWSLKLSRVVYKILNEWLRCSGNLNPLGRRLWKSLDYCNTEYLQLNPFYFLVSKGWSRVFSNI